jgi:YHS domain-containing protein
MKSFEPSGSIPKDPVCGMEADPESPFRTTCEGRDYFFCSQHCLAEFQEDPERYIGTVTQDFACPLHPGVRQGEPGTCPQCGLPVAAVRGKWICPYHPQVLHDEPGKCPIYGMPLIPEPPGRFYTCDMHPKVKQLEPGKCPKCDMTLQPAWAPVVYLRNEWFCPMHPDFVSPTPGTCPQCGMKLAPREMRANEAKGTCPKCGLVIEP